MLVVVSNLQLFTEEAEIVNNLLLNGIKAILLNCSDLILARPRSTRAEGFMFITRRGKQKSKENQSVVII